MVSREKIITFNQEFINYPITPFQSSIQPTLNQKLKQLPVSIFQMSKTISDLINILNVSLVIPYFTFTLGDHY